MLTKHPIIQKNKFSSRLYYDSARSALKTILQELNFSGNKKLLLPSYIGITDREGSGVFDPVEETNTPYDFYEMNPDLGAEKKGLYKKIKTGNYEALLIIHYFGFCQNDMLELLHICKENNVVLIEDCAHTMLGQYKGMDLGSFGDFCFFSLHKFLPITSGGCLKINNDDYLYMLDNHVENKPNNEVLDVVLKANLKEINKKKRENYLHLLDLIKNIEGMEIMYPHLPEGITPHNFPILIKNQQREKVYFKLIENKVPVISLYYRMIQPILDGDFTNSRYLSENILNLPVHQDIQIDDLKYIAKQLKKAI